MIETFMWGYWGWGGSTRHLVEAFDAAEALRGYEPLVFVDVRASRAVRAVGFRGDAFENLLGRDRYRWMKRLGNQAVLDGRDGIEIVDPKAAGDLLDLIVESDRSCRRVIFFCACQEPGGCHRYVVGELLVEEARRRKVALSVSEWPGGTPRHLVAPFPPVAAARASHVDSVSSVPMPKAISPAVGVSLPWGSYATVPGPAGDLAVVLGPAIHRQRKWALPLLLHNAAGEVTERQLRRGIIEYRSTLGYAPRFSMATPKAERFARACTHQVRQLSAARAHPSEAPAAREKRGPC